MSETVVNSRPGKPSSRWGRKLLITAIVLFVGTIVFYFTATSAAFLKGFVLPRASKALGATITVEDASISPFSAVSLRGLKVQTTGEPLIQATSASVRYSLLDIIGGKINVSELTLDSPTVKIVKNADGSGNLDPILKALAASQKAPTPGQPKSSKPPQLDLRNIALKNANFHFLVLTTNHLQQDIDLSSINVTLDQLRNGISGKFNLATEIGFSEGPVGAKPVDLVRTKASADFDFAVTTELKPEHIKGKTTVDIVQVLGSYATLGNLKGVLDLDLTMTEIKKLDLNFTKGGTNLGSIAVTGPIALNLPQGTNQFSLSDAHLKLAVSSIDRHILNIIGARMGIDFNSTTINTVTDIVVEKGAKSIDVRGEFNLGKLSMTQQAQTTPTMDLKAAYQISVDQAAQTAQIKSFTIAATQNANAILTAGLSQPLTLSWNTNVNSGGVDTAAFDLKVHQLNLADWKPLLGDLKPEGMVDLDLHVDAHESGKKIELNLKSAISGLSAQIASNRLTQAGISLAARGQITDFKKISLPEYGLKITRAGQSVASLSGSVLFDTGTQAADVQATLETSVPRLTELLGRADLKATAGSVQFTGRITQALEKTATSTNTAQTVAGKLKLADLTGSFANYRLDRFALGFDCDLAKTNDAIQIHRLDGQLTNGSKPGGHFDVTGGFDLKKQSGSAAVKLVDLNESALKPFLDPALAPRTLTSISINSALNAGFTAQGDGTIKGSLEVSNVLISDPERRLPNIPLALSIQLDAALANNRLTLTQLGGKTTFGTDPAGSFDLTGGYDLKLKTGQGTLKLVDLNQNALRPFVDPALGAGKKLASISINSALDAKYDAQGSSSLKGGLTVANLLITDPEKKMPNMPLNTTLLLDCTYGADRALLKQVAGRVTFGNDAAGDFDATGSYDLKKKSGQASLRLNGLNENALRPFLGSALGEKSLVSIAVNANATAQYDAGGESAVKANFAVTNLVVRDPKNPALGQPLSAQFQLDASLNKNLLNLREFQIALSPTARAKNQLNLAGKLDLTQTNAALANLTLGADSLDVTSFYDLFDNPEKMKKKAAKTPPPPKAPASNIEPAPVNIPLRQSVLDVKIGKFYLREMTIANLSMKAAIDAGQVKLQPIQFSINDAPVDASLDLNLGVPGYQYNLALKADKIPVEPIANSFSPEYSGQAKGLMIADVKIQGAGITGTNLRNNLGGNVFLSFTNADISLTASKWKPVIKIISLALRVPEMDTAPISYLYADVVLGNAQINLRNFIAHSDAYVAETRGVIPLSEVLDDSPINLPVEISLTSKLTQHFKGLASSSRPGYMKLPSFVTLKGNLGAPDAKINYVSLAGATMEGVVGGQTGAAIGLVGDLFGGKKPSTPPPAGTNAPPASTNQPPPANTLGDFLNKFKKKQ